MLRQPVSGFFVALLFLISALSWLLSDINIGEPGRLFENILLSAQALFLHLLVWVYGFEVVRRETSQGLFVLPLSTGLSRSIYWLGRYAGICMMLALFTFVLILVDSLLMFVTQEGVNTILLLQVMLFMVSTWMTLAILMLFATFTSPFSAMLYAILIWVIGHGWDELYLLMIEHQSGIALQVTKIAYVFLPNFSFFDLTTRVLNGLPVDISNVWLIVGYGLGYSLLIMVMANMIYKRKILQCT